MAINIKNWDVEDQQFWKEKGSKIALRNILVSIPALLLAFAVCNITVYLISLYENHTFTVPYLTL